MTNEMTRGDGSTRGGRRLRYAGALPVLAGLVLALAPAHAGIADNALPTPGWVVQSTSPTTHVEDGQRLVINLKSNSDVSINALEIRECRFGVTYAAPADINPDSGNCPPRAVSSSADYFVTRGASDGLTSLAKLASGASVPYFVGAGVVDWSSGTNHTLICDPTHPCALVIKLSIGTSGGSSTVFESLKLTFTDSNPLSACGGFAKGSLATAGSDEISDAWAQWTRAECVRTGKGAPSGVSFPGEAPALASFVNGDLDLVYSAAGYDGSVGLAPADAAGRRPAVAVALALNASVIAAGGGQHQLVNNLPIGDKIRYPDGSLQLSAAEVGALLGGGQSWISRQDKTYGSDILSRNPALQSILYAPDNGVYAPSESLASSWFMTKYLSTLAPADFVRPNVVPPAPHGADASLALAMPPFDQISLYTGRPKVTVPAEITSTDGPIWTMTDLASARALDLTPVALQSGSGFVAPTADSMAAAVAAMQPDASGILVPDTGLATNTVASGAVQPYPLTYVVYAVVPAQPLVDAATCNPRADSQALLTSWLGYLTGAGQQDLPAGMQPLPPALLAQANAALARVGASKVTGDCAGGPHHPNPDGGGDGGGNGGGKGNGSGSGKGNGKGNGKGGHHPSVTPTPLPNNGGSPSFVPVSVPRVPTKVPQVALPGKIGTPGVVRAAEARVKIPGFRGHRVAGAFGGVIALLGIALLMSLAAWYTARSRLRPVRAGSVALLWATVGVTGLALVVLQLGPALQQRTQRALLTRYRAMVSTSANELQGLPGVSKVTKAPKTGSPVGIVEIGALKSQDVVVEGVGAAQTQKGPGHVPGTAGLGQPGNSVLLARHRSYGGAFSHIGRLRNHDEIVVTTTQGQSVYEVVGTRELTIVGDSDAPASLTATGRSPVQLTRSSGRPTKITLAGLYGPTRDNRLTLVTSSGRSPLDTSSATAVVAKLLSKPFVPTPQGVRSSAQTGTQGDRSAWASALLMLLAFAVVIGGSVVLYRKLQVRTAYVLTTAPLIAITVLAGETLLRLLPAWA